MLSSKDRIRLRHAIENRKKEIEENKRKISRTDDPARIHHFEMEIFSLEKEIAYLQRDLERYA